jgi:His-Xaa-Ser system protein HxsD
MEKIKNFKIDKKENSVFLFINPKIYPLEVLYSAGYVLLDRAYVILDGDPKKEIIVQLKAKSKNENLEELALDFNNELISYAVYVVQAARTDEIRKAIVERALLTAEEIIPKEESFPRGSKKEEFFEEEEDEWIDDPLGIAKPWTPEAAKGIKPLEELEEDEEDEDK